MDLHVLRYDAAAGWSVPAFPDVDSDRTLVLAFADPRWADDTGPLRRLADAYPTSTLLGCSTAGEIVDAHLHDGGIAVAIARFAETDLRSAYAPVASADMSHAAGLKLARSLDAPDLRAVFVLSEGLTVNGSELVGALGDNLPEHVIVTGDLAADGSAFERTWVIHDGEPRPQVVSAVGLYGPSVRVGHGSRGGWDIFGPERLVTRAERNMLYELDGRPALDLYTEYLGELADDLPASGLLFPLALRAPPNDEEVFVRTILAVDDDARSLTFAGDVPQGHLAQLMRANLDRLVDGAGVAASDASRPAHDGPVLAIAISCVGRRLVLGERTDEEVEAAFDGLPPGSSQVGFYSYGEISPHATGRCDLHNQTMTPTTVSERA